MFTEILPSKTQETLELLGKQSTLKNFYLSGGTACALHLGHRISEDLDFFTKRTFSSQNLRDRISELSAFDLLSEDTNTLHCILNKTRLSFLHYKYPLLESTQKLNTVAISNLLDVLCTKLDTISARGSKKDFIDVYCAVNQKKYTLEQILAAFQKKYHDISYNLIHILKGLTYFEDADKEDMPRMLTTVSWKETKSFFEKAVRELENIL